MLGRWVKRVRNDPRDKAVAAEGTAYHSEGHCCWHNLSLPHSTVYRVNTSVLYAPYKTAATQNPKTVRSPLADLPFSRLRGLPACPYVSPHWTSSYSWSNVQTICKGRRDVSVHSHLPAARPDDRILFPGTGRDVFSTASRPPLGHSQRPTPTREATAGGEAKHLFPVQS
jgi:hypothetical protein